MRPFGLVPKILGSGEVGPSASEIPDHVQAGIKAFRGQDEVKLEESRLPETEGVELEGVLIAECYLPSHADSLRSSVAELGWDHRTLSDDNVLDWLKAARLRQHVGGWLNLGTIRPPGAKGLMPVELEAELPEHVQYAQARIFHLLASTSTLLLHFSIDEETACQIGDPFRQDYETTARQVRDGWKYTDPLQHRSAEFRKIRRRLVDECADWLRDRAPGFFAETASSGRFPHAEVIMFSESKPCQGHGEYHMNHFMSVMGLEQDSHAFAFSHAEDLLLVRPTVMNDDPSALILTGRRKDVVEELDLRSGSDEGQGRVSGVLSWLLSGTVTVWSLGTVLRVFEAEIAQLRDRLARAETVDGAPDQRLLDIQRQLLNMSQDLFPFATEFEEFCGSKERFSAHLEGEFTPIADWLIELDAPTFLEGLRSSWRDKAGRLLAFESGLRDLTVTAASTASSESQRRLTEASHDLQRRIGVFSALLVLLAIIQTLILAGSARLKSVWDWITSLLTAIV